MYLNLHITGLASYIRRTGSQFDDHKIVTGSSDASVRVWDIKTGALLQVRDQVLPRHQIGGCVPDCRFGHNRSLTVMQADFLRFPAKYPC